ncbi:hypothetical protein [Alysiella crassa]|nr:hypothetical protein [Alysiella crassa]
MAGCQIGDSFEKYRPHICHFYHEDRNDIYDKGLVACIENGWINVYLSDYVRLCFNQNHLLCRMWFWFPEFTGEIYPNVFLGNLVKNVPYPLYFDTIDYVYYFQDENNQIIEGIHFMTQNCATIDEDPNTIITGVCMYNFENAP